MAAAVGWMAGYTSWEPLRLSLEGRLDWRWPFDDGLQGAVTYPLAHFGLVAAIFAAFWPRDGMSPDRRLIAALAAGIAGSLWWWIAYEQWYLSPLHGSIWGLLVGLSSRSGAAATAMGRSRMSVEYL
jgi:hypothetical protein